MENQAMPMQIKRAEWLRQGYEKFGNDLTRWIFICPQCDHEQKPGDWFEAGAQDEHIEYYAGIVCIKCDLDLENPRQVHEIEVLLDNGDVRPVFKFAD